MNWRDQRATVATVIGIAAAVVAFAMLAWSRRWMSDDGLIVVRTVRQLVDGNGPVLNAFERVEADTSTLWTYLVAAVAVFHPKATSLIAVVLGGCLSVAGVVIGLDAARRFHRARGCDGVLVPAGVAVVLGASPFWDYATSGLETGLVTCWSAVAWWLTVTLQPDASRRRQVATAVVFGLGPLVRPDLTIASVVFAAAAWLVVRPRRRAAIVLVAAAIALPVAYEVFRMGYYGALVPLPALAKSAAMARWGRGGAYVLDAVLPYHMWLPLGALASLAAIGLARRKPPRRELIIAGAPLACALALGLYVVRVGGDFMHARMVLPAIFFAVLPAFVLPLRIATAPVLAIALGWAVVTACTSGPHISTTGFIEDERSGYATWTRDNHPINPERFVRAAAPSSRNARYAMLANNRVLITEDGRVTVPLRTDLPTAIAYGYGRLGTACATVPLDGIAVDTLGLGNAVGARLTVNNPGWPGHEKILPLTWQLADYASPDATAHGADPDEVRSARHALGCGDLAELLDSVRGPLTMGRFFSNLTGAIARTRLVIPADPVEAEWKFCGAGPDAMRVIVSSSYEGEGWSRARLIDGAKAQDAPGFSSHTGIFTDHEEWIELRFAHARPISQITLYPLARGEGYPIDFSLQIWSDGDWVERRALSSSPAFDTPQTYSWSPPDTTDRVRLVAKRLRTIRGGYVIALAEIEAK